MSDYPKVNNEVSSSSVDTNSCSSKNSASTNETVNSIKYQGKFNYLLILCNNWLCETVVAKISVHLNVRL